MGLFTAPFFILDGKKVVCLGRISSSHIAKFLFL